MIPRLLHTVWVGDASLQPNNCIETWHRLNPSWRLRVWTNRDLEERAWQCQHHMDVMRLREWNGVADMMRWEILLAEGGFAVDADSICVRPLDDALFDGADACASFENERVMPGLLAAGYVAAVPGHAVIQRIVASIHDDVSVIHARAWKTVGPRRLTQCHQASSDDEKKRFRIWPSHHFMPVHHSGVTYQGDGVIYAHQEWASTKRSYGELHLRSLDALDASI